MVATLLNFKILPYTIIIYKFYIPVHEDWESATWAWLI